ncbi:MAG: hypothetical protein E7Z84_00145 [Methanosphaera stadtmanae]|nr:hypothetical protein [Methanosphaera stadtmanae]
MSLDSSIETTLNEIQKVMNTNSIIGNPIKTNEKIIIPVSKAALGFGVGNGKYEGGNKTELGGVGGGGSIDPVAFLVIYTNIPGPDGVQVIPVDAIDTPLEDLLQGVGGLLFSLIDNSTKQPQNSEDDQGTIDKIKTKIKTEKDSE